MTLYKGSDAMGRSSTDNLFIRAWKSDGQPVTYQVYVADYYSADWRFYSSAYDIDGHRFDVTMISRDVGSCSRYLGCSKTETLGLNVTRDYLEKYRSRDLTFKLIGKAGEQVFSLPAAHVAEFLDSVADESPRAALVTAPPSTISKPIPVPTRAPEPATSGQDAPNAGRAATVAGCTQQPRPALVSKGPGFETYSVACTNGDALVIRCEFGNCRALR